MTQYTARKALKKKNKKKLQHLNGTSEMENDPEIKQLEARNFIANRKIYYSNMSNRTIKTLKMQVMRHYYKS